MERLGYSLGESSKGWHIHSLSSPAPLSLVRALWGAASWNLGIGFVRFRVYDLGFKVFLGFRFQGSVLPLRLY